LEEIPGHPLSSLTNLRILYVSGNPLLAIPNDIGMCSSLQRLDVSRCRLHDLPDDLLMCLALKYLNIYSNSIVVFSPEIKDMPNLMHLLWYDMKEEEAIVAKRRQLATWSRRAQEGGKEGGKKKRAGGALRAFEDVTPEGRAPDGKSLGD
jgi:hypothetical protein